MCRTRDFGVTLLALLILPAPAGRQGPRPTTPAMARDSAPGAVSASAPLFRTSGAFFALSVPDLDSSIQWYTEKLGLQIVMRPPKEDRAEVAVLEGNGLMVELLQLADAKPFSQAAPGISANYLVHGYFKAGIVVEDYDATLEALRSRGVEIAMGPFPARAGQRANVIVRDNSGNLIQFFGR